MNSRKRKERKQIITLGICALAILLLIVVYSAVKNADRDESEESDTLELMDIGTFTIIDENYSLITALSYTYNGATLSFRIEDGKWVLDGEEDYPLDQEKLVYMSQAISDYGGYRRLTYKEGNDASYGFDDPLYDITATYYESSGDETYSRRYLIGDQNSLTGYYYFREVDSDYIYMVNDALFSYFAYSKNQLFESVSTPSPELSDIKSLKVITPEKETDVEIPEAEAEADEDGNIVYSSAERIMNVIHQKIKLNYSNNVDYGVGEAKMAEYGLDSSAMKIVIDYTYYREVSTEEGTSSAKVAYDAEFTLLLGARATVSSVDSEGNETEREIVYVAVEGSDTVYSMSAEDYDEILDALS